MLNPTRCISGRPILVLYLQDRLTSAQRLSRNEDDKEVLLGVFGKAHFFLRLLGLVKLVGAAYQGPGDRLQSVWFSSIVSHVCGAAVIRLLSPFIHSDGE